MDQDSTVVGLDVHKDTITTAVLLHAATRPREVVTIENHPKAVARLVKRLTGNRKVVFVYEAGPCGYGSENESRSDSCSSTDGIPIITL